MGGMGGGGSSSGSDTSRAAAARKALAQWRAEREAGHVATD
jgi:hypothetical protein